MRRLSIPTLVALSLGPGSYARGGPVEDTFRLAESAFSDGKPAEAAQAWRDGLSRWLSLAPSERFPLVGEAELALRQIDELSSEVGDAPDSIQILEKLSEVEAVGPPQEAAALRIFAAHSRYLLGWARLEAAQGLEKARQAWGPLGLLESWRIIGPFDNERGSQFLTELPPEKEIKLDAAYDGKKRPVRWRTLPARPVGGTLDFSALLRPNEQCLAYALTFVHSEREQDASLRLGTSEGYRLWVNGQLAASSDIHRSFDFDQDAIGLRLPKGWSSILVKVSQTTDAWELAARLTQPDGAPLEGVKEGLPEAPEESPRLEGEAPRISVAEGLVPLLTSGLENHANDARAHYVLGVIVHHRQAHDENVHPDTELLNRAVQLDGSQALYHYWVAQSHQRAATIAAQKDDNAWRASMEKAASLGCGRAAEELGSYYASTFENVARARGFAEQALAKNPNSADAFNLLGNVDARMGVPRAKEKAQEKIWALPHRPVRALLRKAAQLRGEGKLAEAEKLYRDVASRNAISSAHEVYAGLSHLLLEAGRSDEALQILRSWSTLEPFNLEPFKALAKSYVGLERMDEAVASLTDALNVAPEDHELVAEKGKLLLRAGKKDQGIIFLGQALELQPNLPDVRDYVEFLRASKSGFEDEFRRDVTALVKGAFDKPDPNAGGEPARILLDLAAIQVNPDGTTKAFSQSVIQVLNERGIRMYDRFRTHYAEGEQILEFKKARVTHPDGTSADAKLSRFGGSSSDSAGNFAGASVDMPPLSAGDVLQVEYVREDLSQSFFGDYFGHREVFQAQVPIQEKTLILKVPAERKFYFHQRNMKLEPVQTRDEKAGTITYSWTLSNIAKLDPEPGMPDADEVSPVLEISTFQSWDAFNKWYWSLIKKQFETSPELSKKVRELVSGAETETDKIRAIYNFVVTDIRYNAWEFGVHGFKPYNAATIFARKFGDCKDKALLISVMLKEAGVTARPVLIKADDRRGKEDLTLPMVNHFNHCIAYVPSREGREELFLDGTAQFHSYREVPSMDRGATVVVVGEDKASVQQVPWNQPAELAITEEAVVTIRADLSADMQVRARTSGDYSVFVRHQFEIASERRTRLEKMYGKRFAASTIKEESFSNLLNLDEPVSFSVSLAVPRFVVEAPEGLSIRAAEDFFGSTQDLSDLGSLEKREYDVLLGNPRLSSLRTVYNLPEGFKVKSLPAPHELKNRFGRLKVSYVQDGPNKLVAERIIEVTNHRVSLADYGEFREFSASVSRLEDEKIVLERA